MRRSYGIDSGYINYLKSLGCVLYLPLGKNDYHDYIGGRDLSLTGNGSLVFDDTMNTMLLSTPSSYPTVVATLDSLLPTSDWSANVVSGCAVVRRGLTSYQNKGAELFCIGNTNNCLYPTLWVNGTSGNMSYWDNNFHDVGMVFSGSGRTWYQDGTVSRTDTYGGRAPSSWGQNKEWFISTWSGSNAGAKLYIADIMLFNKALSLADYRKIQGY